jgi:hypothetical protein
MRAARRKRGDKRARALRPLELTDAGAREPNPSRRAAPGKGTTERSLLLERQQRQRRQQQRCSRRRHRRSRRRRGARDAPVAAAPQGPQLVLLQAAPRRHSRSRSAAQYVQPL